MPKTIKAYTLKELSNEHEEIIIHVNDSLEIKIEREGRGARIYFPFGADVEKREFDYVVRPVKK